MSINEIEETLNDQIKAQYKNGREETSAIWVGKHC